MDINAFQNLPKEAQFAEAGRIAGLEPRVFDGLWRTESGRGANQFNAASGAEGHMQLMPKTRKVMEGRFGQAIDPYDFGQSLYTAAHLMKENMGRFKNVGDALRAYNGGWDASKWSNSETAAYAQKVLGTDQDPAILEGSTLEATASGAGRRFVSAQEAFTTVLELGPKGAKRSPAAIAVAALNPNPATPDEGTDAYRFGNAQAEKAQKAKQNEIDNMGVQATLIAAADSSLVVNGLKWATRERHAPEAGYAVKEDDLRGYDADEQSALLDAKGHAEFARIKFDLDNRREQARKTNLHGGWVGFGASIVADLPGAVLTGGAATFGAKALGFGAIRLAEQGRKGAALAALTAENVGGNVLATAALDASGYNQGSADYALGAVAGLLGPALGGRYIGRIADQAQEQIVAVGIAARAVEKQAALAQKAASNLGPDATPAALHTEIARLDAEGIKQEIASHQGSIAADRRIVNPDELDEMGNPVAIEHAAPEATAQTTPEAPAEMPLAGLRVEGLRDMFGQGVAAKFESPEYQAARIKAMQENPQWVSNFHAVAGMDYQTAAATLPKGLSLGDDVVALRTKGGALDNSLNLLDELIQEYMPGAQVMFTTRRSDIEIKRNVNGAIRSAGNVHIISVNPDNIGTANFNKTVMHELGHAVYHNWAPTAPPEILAKVDADWLAFTDKVFAGDVSARADRFSVTAPQRHATGPLAETTYGLSRDEYVAEQFITHVQNRMLGGEYGKLSKGVIDQVINGLKAVLGMTLDLIQRGKVKPGKGADEFFRSVLNGIEQGKKAGDDVLPAELRSPTVAQGEASYDIPPKLAKEVADFLADPVAIKYGLDVMPLATPANRAEAKMILSIYKKADNPQAVWNNLDMGKLNKLLAAAPDSWGLDPTSNAMLRSANPVARMLATELLENGGGAGGRRSTASIAKYMNERRIMGNSIQDMQMHYQAYRQAAGGSVLKDFTNGNDWRAFNKLVAEEIEGRRSGNPTASNESVRNAADVVEGAYERARVMQVDAKTIGWASLAETSRGYMPHRMSTQVVRNLTNSQRRAVQSALTDQFVSISGFDVSFSDQLAAKYMDIVSRRALGGFEANVGIHQTGAPDVVKEALEQMGLNRADIDSMMKKYVAGGPGHTKKRLELDLSRSYTNDDGTSFRLLDLFETDQFTLLRSQSQRVSGEVALARHGVMGKPGLALMRRAMEFGADNGKTQPKEIEAFDQVAAEFMGQPFGTQNKWVDRALQANSLSSLGGMGFNQLGEMINMAMTLGVKSTAANVAGMPRLYREVHKLAKGEAVDNGWLGSLEHFGGAQFGTDNHKMVFPFDVPDHPYQTMGADSVTAVDRLLRGGLHAQGTLSAWRALHAAQTRGAAEQIVMKSLRFIREGTESVALRDMGITPDMAAAIKADMTKITRWKDGRMVGLDITKLSNMEVANAYVQAVHRGSQQIIQGTFIGESGKYVHSSWGRLMTQFRSFGLTAIDKQWARQKGNYGTATALLMTLGAMSAAAPIYMARTYLASVGRQDQEAYLDKQLHPTQIGRATMNYIATSGLAGDFIDAFTAATGVGQVTGGRSGAQSDFIGNVIAPAAGKADKVWGGVQQVFKEGDVHGLVKELPFARLPWLIPAVNELGK